MITKRDIKIGVIKFISSILGSKNVLAHNMNILGRNLDDYVITVGDDIRTSSLELIANEIYENRLFGNVAELGVFQGEFASKINQAFPDRQLYLFDTFEELDKRDKKTDTETAYSTANQAFSNTSIDIVMNKMKHKENCIIKKGVFPESAKSIEDIFVFVSIDADLCNPIYDGLCWFYPKLCKGGVIFVHDYNNDECVGAKKEVVEFCKENDIKMFPLSDICGSAVIIKN